MKWKSVKDELPPLPEKYMKMYLVVTRRGDRQFIRLAKWIKKTSRKCTEKTPYTQRQLASKEARFMCANFSRKEITHWLELPECPEENDSR